MDPEDTPRMRRARRDLELLARLMDSAFGVPGSRFRFGLDSLLGLIPGLGDAATSLVSLYLMGVARQQGIPRITMLRMALNVAIDLSFGAIPIIGDAFDFFWKANERNLALLQNHLAATPAQSRRLTLGDWLFVGFVFVLFVAILIGAAMLAYYLVAAVVSLFVPHRAG